MDTPVVSIVIPVRNAASYLRQCLTSIAEQTYENLEIICVDNGSTDDSIEIVSEYVSNDSRFLSLSSGGFAGDARNKGLERATGDYIIFLDSDDYFDARMIEYSLAKAVEEDADLVLFGGRRYDSAKEELSEKCEFLNSSLVPSNKVFNYKDAPSCLFQITNPAPWTKFYRTAFVKSSQIRFQSIPNSNDLYFGFATLASAERIVAFEGDFVRYRINTNCSTQDGKDKDPLCCLQAYEKLYEYLNSKSLYKELEETYVTALLSSTRYILNTLKSQRSRELVLQQYCNGDSFPYFDSMSEELFVHKRGLPLYKFIKAAVDQYRRMNIDGDFQAAYQVVKEIKPAAETALISIIIPSYNAEDYLRDTFSSLSQQSDKRFEVVAINDGSTDGTLDLLMELADSLDCEGGVRVCNQCNGGLSVARNTGIDASSGEYVCFLDADDMLELNSVELMHKHINSDAPDLLMYGATSFFESQAMRREHGSYQHYYDKDGTYETVETGLAMMSQLVANDDYRPSACMYLMARDLLTTFNIRFRPGVLHEDNEFTFKIFCVAKRVKFIDEPLYKRRVHEDSIMTRSVSFANCWGYYVAALEAQKFLEKISDTVSFDSLNAPFFVIENMKKNCLEAYKKLDDDQLGALFALSNFDRCLFIQTAEGNVDSALELARTRKKLKKIRNSYSYKIGYAICRPLVIVRNVLRH